MKQVLLILCCFFPLFTACNLKTVNVNAPDINCVFNPTCTIAVNDSTDTIPLPAGGTNFLQSRTFTGQPGSPADGLYGYQYRIDLRNAVGITHIPCVTEMTIEFGPVISTLDYDGDGDKDQVYVVTSGGLGSVGLSKAEKNGNEVTFTFSSAVCAGGSPGAGQSTFFFGLTSTKPPEQVTAKIKDTSGTELEVQGRAPESGGE